MVSGSMRMPDDGGCVTVKRRGYFDAAGELLGRSPGESAQLLEALEYQARGWSGACPRLEIMALG